jgi:hypothetical protein
MWMARRCPHIPFERYADDAICHCKSAEEAQVLWSALADRFAACKLVLHPSRIKFSSTHKRVDTQPLLNVALALDEARLICVLEI